MRKLPTILAAGFIAITLVRVARFADEQMKAGFLGWLFAAFLGAAVFGSAYFTRVSVDGKTGEQLRSKRAKSIAWVSLILFIFVDGLFNLAEVLRTVLIGTDKFQNFTTVIYGIFRMLAAGILGVLQGRVDRLPALPKKNNVWLAIKKRAVAALESGKAEAQPAPQNEQTIVATKPTTQPTAKKPSKPSVDTDRDKLPTERQKECYDLLVANHGKTVAEFAPLFGVSTRQAASKMIITIERAVGRSLVERK